MSIQTDDAVQQPTFVAPAQTQSAQQSTSGVSGLVQQAGNWGIFDIGNLGGINLNFTSEALMKLTENLTATYKSLDSVQGLDIRVVPIDRNKVTSLYYSSIAVCVSNGDGPVTYHLVLIEDSNEPLQPRVETHGGRQIQIDRLASDVYDNDYQRIANGVLQAAFGGKELRPCSGQIVFKGFTLEDKTALRNLAINALKPPLMDVVSSAPDFVEMDLTKYLRDAKLSVNIDFNNTTTSTKTDYAEMPVRSPVSLKLIGTSNQRANSAQINAAEQTTVVSELGGYVDVVWAPNEVAVNPYLPVQQQVQKFAARFVMTNLENRLLMTIPSQLLALATSLSLRDSNNWFPAFMPKSTSGKEVDITDVGALNIEANVENAKAQYGTRMNTKAATFTQQSLGAFLSMAVRPGLIYSLDVSMCGADTWYNEVFMAAAAGNASAQKAIIDAANTLTGGHFGRHWNAADSAVFVNDDIIQLGFYINKDGQKRDIREIDYLAVLNLVGEKNPASGADWSQTYLNLNYPLVQRLDARRKMITELVRGDVRFTGYARRVTFTNVFLDTLITACRAAGLEMSINSNMLGIDYNAQRSAWMNFGSSAVLPGSTQMFQMGGVGQPAFANMQFGQRQYSF